MPSRALPFSLLRLALMGLLMLGICLQPVLAAACDVEDARVALDAGTDAAVAADAADGSRDCCNSPACGDCCLHAAATLPAIPQAMAFAAVRMPSPPLRAGIAASAYPVDSRPPIRG